MLWCIFAVVICVLLFHVFVYHQYNWPSTIKIIDKIPGPNGPFYFGSAFRHWNIRSEDRLEDIANSFKIYGSTFREWFSGVPIVFISEIEDFQTVLSCRANSAKGIMYRNILPWLGQGLLTSSGMLWHTRRRLITPAFHFSILQGFVNTFNKNTKILIKRLADASKNEAVEVSCYINSFTLDNVCETAMGTAVNAQSGEPNMYVSYVTRMGAIICERMFSPVLYPEVNFALSALGREHSTILNALHAFTSKVIRNCKQMKPEVESTAKSKPNQNDDDVGVYKNKMTFLRLLLEKQQEFKLTDNDIREEVDTFMFEGHDTTSVAITWALFELGHHADVQQKCFEEQINIFGTDIRMPTHRDVMEMTYLKRVIQETLRIHPSVPAISRKFDVDLQLKDYLVPAGTEIVLSLYSHHRNEKIFPEPEKFDPDRFKPEAINKRHGFAYIPFSAGLRNCVGQKFAMLELHIVLSTIIRTFELKTLGSRENVKAVPDLTLRPLTQIQWKLTPRTTQ